MLAKVIKNEPKVALEIAKVLKEIGNRECLEKAAIFEKDVSLGSSLDLRELRLRSSDVTSIARILEHEKYNDSDFIGSVSLSYNRLIGDVGATLIVRSLPASVTEIGLVGCGIGDDGGAEILSWMRKSSNLKMVCIEKNNFSDKLKRQFTAFGKDNSEVQVVV